MSYTYALIGFADIRGFTVWSSHAEVTHHLQPFMAEFYEIFYEVLSSGHDWALKPNGDGVMFVRETGQDHEALDAVLDSFVYQQLPVILTRFQTLKERYRNVMRFPVPLRLGFGVNAGIVYRLSYPTPGGPSIQDFASGPVNLASRLCDHARPEGLVIASDAFPKWRPRDELRFQSCHISVKSISEPISVWISSEISGTSVPREQRQFTLEFHIGTVCYSPEREAVILAHRTDNRKLYPGHWEAGGGQMYDGEDIPAAARRICRAEYGIDVSIRSDIAFVPFKIEVGHTVIPGIKLLCLFNADDFHGPVDPGQHSEARLIPVAELMSDRTWPPEKLIPGSKDNIRVLLDSFSRLSRSTKERRDARTVRR